MNKHITIITLGVHDLKRSTEFYENVFGWALSDHSNESISFFKLEQMLLSLYPLDKLAEDAEVQLSLTPGFKPISLAHNVSSEKEVDNVIAELESKGANTIKKPEKVFWGGYSGYVSDPDDYLWEIAYNPFM